MKRIWATSLILVATCLSVARPAFAQKEMVALLVMMSEAPDLCKWTDAPSSMKIDEQIDAQIKALGITREEYQQMRTAAKAQITADPANCNDAGFRSAYDEAAK